MGSFDPVRALIFPIFCGLFGVFGLWVGVTSLLHRSPRVPLPGSYEARVRTVEKDPAYSAFHRKWWWVVDIRFADGRSRSFRQEVPRGLVNRFDAGEAVRVCSFEWRSGPFRFEGLEIDDPVVRNFSTATAFVVGTLGLAISILIPLHTHQRHKALSARKPPPN